MTTKTEAKKRVRVVFECDVLTDPERAIAERSALTPND